ncbi:MAG: DUF4442 domain-containing protein [Sideroxyarcus sp.]|nr:DUF4442 domain-containing protein [Sideroxyarcus sp.]
MKWLKKLPEAWRPHAVRIGFNLHPAYRRTGGRVEHVSPDLTCIRIRLPLNRGTRNLVGSIFGGSLFAVTDGPHPFLLLLGLGSEYVVWDKAASIQYRRPGRTTLYAECIVTPQELDEIRDVLTRQPDVDRVYRIEIKDGDGIIHAIVERTVYISRKEHYKQKSKGGAGSQ